MSQLHKRFNDEQLRFVLQQYEQKVLAREDAQRLLQVGKTRFFALLQAYRQAPESFSVAYHRATPTRLGADVEQAIERELLRDRELIQNPDLPISGYNYSFLRDRLLDQGIQVSLTTIIQRAQALGCYQARPKQKVHDREVLTTAVGALIQHDASIHLWSPYADSKWTLITSIDDYSRKLLYAEFFPHENTWVHIQAARAVTQQYGLPLKYYVDSLRVFRFVQHRDSVWRQEVLGTDQADPQWKQVMGLLGIEVIYALSPQAKGKIERPFRWMQDRIVRLCSLEKIATLPEARSVLQAEVERYNARQVHSTTQEIPNARFAQALDTGNSLFRPFALPRPYTAPEDVFCLRETRMLDGYRKISLHGHKIEIPGVLPHEQVEIHLIPDAAKQAMHLRIWLEGKLVAKLARPLPDFGVHF